MTDSKPPQHAALVPLRLALIGLIALVAGAVVGLLTYLASHNVAQAVLAGLVAAGTALVMLDKLIGR